MVVVVAEPVGVVLLLIVEKRINQPKATTELTAIRYWLGTKQKLMQLTGIQRLQNLVSSPLVETSRQYLFNPPLTMPVPKTKPLMEYAMGKLT